MKLLRKLEQELNSAVAKDLNENLEYQRTLKKLDLLERQQIAKTVARLVDIKMFIVKTEEIPITESYDTDRI